MLDLLYPRECTVCSVTIAEPGRVCVCATCEASLEWIEPPACPRCGAAVERESCRECEGKSFAFEAAWALGRYEGKLREAVLAMKFRGGRHLADEFGRRLAGRLTRRYESVVAVPMSAWRVIGRGYNPADLVAERLAHHGMLPFRRRGLRKIRRTRPQVELSLEDRLRNPKGAYRARPAAGPVLLVDDVLTTGGTANACAEALRAAGATEVHLAVVAR